MAGANHLQQHARDCVALATTTPPVHYLVAARLVQASQLAGNLHSNAGRCAHASSSSGRSGAVTKVTVFAICMAPPFGPVISFSTLSRQV